MGKHVRLAEAYKDRLYRARSEDGKVLATIVGTTPVYLEDPVPTEVLKRLTTGFLVEVSEADYKQAVEAEQKKQAESQAAVTAATAVAAPAVAAPAAGPDVAALEARVAELEAKLEAMSAQSEEPEGEGGDAKADAGAGGKSKSKSSANSNSDPK
jgi:hypothetical protein